MIRLTPRGLLLLLSLSALPARAADPAAGAAKPSRPALAPGQDEWDPDYDPPQGSAKDLALWREGRVANHRAITSMLTARKLMQRAKAADIVKVLEARASQAPAEEAEPLRALAARTNAAWTDTYQVMKRKWPIDPTRACGYPLLNFESALRAAADAKMPADLARSREELTQCVGKANMASDALEKVSAPFKAALQDAEAALLRTAARKDPAAPSAGPAAEQKGAEARRN